MFLLALKNLLLAVSSIDIFDILYNIYYIKYLLVERV